MLEGGYSLEALEVSTEAVVRVLKTNPNDEAAFKNIVEDYGATEGKNTYQSLLAFIVFVYLSNKCQHW